MSLYVTPILPDELYHFGIKGQKWGRRRFQNEDMTWTAAGKERYGSASDGSHKVSAEEKKKTAVKDDNSSSAKSKKTRTPEEEAKAASSRKKALKIGLAIAGTALAAYGAYKVGEYASVNKKSIEAVKKLRDSEFDLATLSSELRSKSLNKGYEGDHDYEKLVDEQARFDRNRRFTEIDSRYDDKFRKGLVKDELKYRREGRINKVKNTLHIKNKSGYRSKTGALQNVENQRNSNLKSIQRTKSEIADFNAGIEKRKLARAEMAKSGSSYFTQRPNNTLSNSTLNTFSQLDSATQELLKKNQRLLRNP